MSGDQLERMSQGHLQSLAHHPEKSRPRLCSPPKLHESFLSTHVVYLQQTRCIRHTLLQLFVARDFALMLIHLIGEYSGGSFFEKAALLISHRFQRRRASLQYFHLGLAKHFERQD